MNSISNNIDTTTASKSTVASVKEADTSTSKRKKSDAIEINFKQGTIEDHKKTQSFTSSHDLTEKKTKSTSNSQTKSKAKLSNNTGATIKKGKRRVSWREKDMIVIQDVESYRKYNVDMSYNEPEASGETTRCRCIII